VAPQVDAAAESAAWSKQYDDAQAAKKSQEAQQPNEDQHPLTQFANWATNLSGRVSTSVLEHALNFEGGLINKGADALSTVSPAGGRAMRDIATGATRGVVNTLDTAHSALVGAARNIRLSPNDPGASPDEADPTGPVWAHAKTSIQDFTDAVKVKDPTLADNMLQFTAQVAPSYAAASRMLQGTHRIANVLISGAAADATALEPNAPRFADTLRMLQQTDGKIAKALNEAGPYGLNAYINYLASDKNETEAQGRFKNALDGLLPNFLGSELLHGAGITVKQGVKGVRYLIDRGVGSDGELAALGDRPPLRQDAQDPMEAEAAAQAARDADAARANPTGKRPPLVQGGTDQIDPMESVVTQQAREDAAARGRVTPQQSLEADSTIGSIRGGVQMHSASGLQQSTHNVVSLLARNMSDASPEGAFYKELFGKLSGKNLEGQIVPPGMGKQPVEEAGTRGYYSGSEDTIGLHSAAFKNNTNFAHTLGHEAVHMATFRAVKSDPAAQAALSDVIDQARAAPEFSALKKRDQYGLLEGKPTEVVAEAEANPRFQQFLKTAKGKDGRPLWDHYKEAIGTIFGLSAAAVASPYFDKVLTREEGT
jgi:hypothetical protein